jgi:hypothetical protein
VGAQFTEKRRVGKCWDVPAEAMLLRCKLSFRLTWNCEMGHVRRKCLDFIRRTGDGVFHTNHHSSWNFFYLSNVGVSVNPQLLVPSHFLLAKLPPELPGTTIKTELSSSVCETTIHQIGWFPPVGAFYTLASSDVNPLPWLDLMSLEPLPCIKETTSGGLNSVGYFAHVSSTYFKTVKSPESIC